MTNRERAYLSLITSEILDCETLAEAKRIAMSWVSANELTRVSATNNTYMITVIGSGWRNILDSWRRKVFARV